MIMLHIAVMLETDELDDEFQRIIEAIDSIGPKNVRQMFIADHYPGDWTIKCHRRCSRRDQYRRWIYASGHRQLPRSRC